MTNPMPGHNIDASPTGVAEPADSPPDWTKINEQIRCPMCEYNLRGLAEPRCPECGYMFRWQEMLDRRRRHEYLFEHHPEKTSNPLLGP